MKTVGSALPRQSFNIVLRTLFFLLVFFPTSLLAQEEARRIKVANPFASQVQDEFGWTVQTQDADGTVFQLVDEDIEKLAQFLHEKSGRCGGFKDITEGELSIPSTHSFRFNRNAFADDREPNWKSLIDQVSEDAIRQRIAFLSSLYTRKYNSETGRDAATWVADTLRAIAKDRADQIEIEFVDHQKERRGWIMPSLIVRLKSPFYPNDSRVIIGGHLDSINWSLFGSHAPGADDNASGVSVAMEVMKILIQSGVTPHTTVEFMAYSAEEIGLLGSQSIARRYRREGIDVLGVMQLDMVLQPSADEAIYLVTDHVHSDLTSFVRKLGSEALGYNVKSTICGYACSDHASWTAAGYPAVFPFESDAADANEAIHTDKDTLETAGNLSHAAKYAELGLAFIWELAFDQSLERLAKK